MFSFVEFYRGEAPDPVGRSLQDIWQWDAGRLEWTHNYIQILFPNRDPSAFNWWAPTLDEETIAAFRADPALRANLARSHDLMLRFYGLEYDPATKKIVKRPDFSECARNWISPWNHNYLRITRILLALMDLGLEERAQAFFAALEEIYRTHGKDIGKESLGYWRAAVLEGPTQRRQCS